MDTKTESKATASPERVAEAVKLAMADRAQANTMATGFLTLAKHCIKDANENMADARAIFKGACASAEETARNTWAAENKADVKDAPRLSHLLPSWSVYKSNILSVMAAPDQDIRKCGTMTDVFKAADANRGNSSTGTKSKGTYRVTDLTDAQSAVLGAFIKAFAELSAEGRTKACEQIIQPATAALEWMAGEGAKVTAPIIVQVQYPGTQEDRKEKAKRGGSR